MERKVWMKLTKSQPNKNPKVPITETVSLALTPLTFPMLYSNVNVGSSGVGLYVDDALELNRFFIPVGSQNKNPEKMSNEIE